MYFNSCIAVRFIDLKEWNKKKSDLKMRWNYFDIKIVTVETYAWWLYRYKNVFISEKKPHKNGRILLSNYFAGAGDLIKRHVTWHSFPAGACMLTNSTKVSTAL